jgi:hypothetical protein
VTNACGCVSGKATRNKLVNNNAAIDGGKHHVAITPRNKRKKDIMIGSDSRNTDDSEIDESDEANEPQDPAVDWVHEVMRLSTAGNDMVFNAELTTLVDELGIEFVSQHACEVAAEGGERCPEGHCEVWGEYCTCVEGMHQYIEDFIGFPIEK